MSHSLTRSRRAGRSAVIVAALALTLSALPSAAWASPDSARGHNGGSVSAGKPCDGCVGNADDKAPPGQTLYGEDDNAGYECDRNRGVGRGNPAHFACVST